MGVDVGTATGYLDLDISGFLAGLRSAQSEAQKATSNIATQIGNGFQGVGKSLASAGSTLTKSVTTPIVGLGTAIVKTSADFESSMSKVQAISGATGSDFVALNAKAREMGAKTKFSATEAAEAFQYMAMAGWDVDNMMGGITGVMNLAAASGEDLATVSDIVTDAMTAFGLSASGTSKVLKDGVQVEVDNTTRFVDALAAASNSSNTNVSMLGESFKYVAPVAGALGYSVEDVAIALGLMANQGIKSSQAGTALRTMLTNMANPTDTMAAAMDALGVSLENDDGSMKSLMEVMQDLRKGFGQGHIDADEFSKSMQELQNSFDEGKISEDEYADGVENLMVAMYGAEGAQKAQLAAQLAGKTGMAGLLAIVNTGEEDFNNLADSIYNAAGTSQEMADIMQDNLSGQITIMLSALQELALQFGEILLPHIKNFVAWLQELIAKLQQMSPEQKEQVVKWAAIAAAIGPVLLVLGKLIVGIGNVLTTFGKIPGMITKLKAGFGLLKGAIAGVSAPVVAIVAVVGTLIAAFKHLWETNEEFRNKITAIWDGLKAKFEEFGQGIVDRLNALGFDFENITEVLSAIWNGFCELLAPVFEGVFSQLSNILSAALDILTGIFDVFIGIFTGNWEQAWNGVKEIFGAIWDFIKNTFQNWADAFKGIADVVLGWFGTSWEEVWTGVKDFFVNIWEGIKSFFENIVNGIKTFASNAWNAIKTTVTTVFSAISSFFSTVWNAIYTTVSNVVTNIYNFVSSIFNTIRDTISTVMNTIRSTIQTVWNTIYNTIKSVLDTIWQTIKTVFDTIFNTIKSVLDTIWNTIQNVWNNILYAITLVVVAIQDVIKNVFEAIKAFLSGNVEECKNKLNNAWTTIKNLITELVNTIRNTISTVFEAIKNIITTIMNAIQTTITTIWNAIKTVVTTVVDGIKNTINTVWNAIKTIIETVMNGIKTVITNVWNAIKTTISTVINSIKSTLETVWNAIKTTITNVVNGIKQTVSQVFEAMKTAVVNTVNNIKTSVTNTFNNIKSSLINIANNIKSSVSQTFEALKTAMSNAINNAKTLVVNAMTNAKNGVVNVWNGITDTFANIGKNIIQGIINGIGSMVSSLYDSIKNALSGLVDKAKSALGINSPSRVMRDQIGKWLPPGIAVGFESAMSKAAKDMQDSLDDGIDSLEAEDVNVGVQNDMISVASSVADYFESIEARLAYAVASMRSSLEYLIAAGAAAANGVSIGYVGYGGITKSNSEDSGKPDDNNSKGNGGNTYVFYTTKAIDEIEAARQMQRAERDMAEGFA